MKLFHTHAALERVDILRRKMIQDHKQFKENKLNESRFLFQSSGIGIQTEKVFRNMYFTVLTSTQVEILLNSAGVLP